MRNAAVDPKIDICASVGCDGTLIMHKVADCDYISRRKIAEKTQNFAPQTLSLKWSHDGQALFCAGKESLTVVTRQPIEGDHPFEKIAHKASAISLIEIVSSDSLITAGLDKKLKVWDVSSGTPECTHTYTSKTAIMNVAYSPRSQMIAFMDSNCSVGIVSLDMSKARAASAEDVDMEDIDIQDIEDNVSEEAPSKKPDLKDEPMQQSQQPPSSQHLSSYKGAPKRQPQ